MQLTAVFTAVLIGVACANPQGFQDSFSANLVQGSRGSFGPATTEKPLVPIIRHINRVNNDGSYTFGYESGDGTFRVETRGLDGIIKGKYGYIDETGQRKEVDYQAGSATGYEPRGQGITVPPRPPPRPPGQEFLDYDDGSGTTPRPRNRVRVQQQQQHHQPSFIQQAPPPPPPPAPAPQPIPRPVPQQQQFVAPPPPAIGSSFAPAPISAPQPSAAASFRAPTRQFASPSGPSPIEQFLRQQLSGPAQAQPQQPF